MPLDAISTPQAIVQETFGPLVGRRVLFVLALNSADHERFLRGSSPNPTPAILFDDGTVLVLTADPEGNGPGWGIVAQIAPRRP